MLKSRMAFVGIDQQTKASLQEYLPELKKALPVILDKFYAHISKWPDLASMFKSPESMKHAKKAQEEHWIRLFTCKFDEDYAQSVRRIGLIHSKIGLEPTWYIGAYAFTMNYLYENITHQYHSYLSPKESQKKTALLMRAINQCVMIDMDMAITVYLDENKRTYQEKLNEIANRFEQTIGTVVDGISSAATELEASSASLTKAAKITAENIDSVSERAIDAAANVNTVSVSADHLSSSILNVADMAGKSKSYSQNAVVEADQSVQIMAELKHSIDKVNAVTDLITSIAEKTNLLALNATIEAARAGDSGKGFAVVANEVKALSTQTSKATEDIRKQIADILERSDAVAKSIETVKSVISDVNTVSNNTADAVEIQRSSLSGIAQNVSEALTSTSTITDNVEYISVAANETGNSAEQVLGAVTELAMQSNKLRTTVVDFIADIKNG